MLTALSGSLDAQLLCDVISRGVTERGGAARALAAVVQMNLQGGATGRFQWIGTRRVGVRRVLHGYKRTPGHVCPDLQDKITG